MKTHKNLYLGRYTWAMVLTGALFSTSCSEETIFEEQQVEMSGEGIYFGLTEANNSWEPDSRSAKKGNKFVMRSENSEDTLCVSTSVQDGIYSSNQIQSRAARETTLNGSEFNVSAYYYPTGASTPNSILFNQDVTVDGNGGTSMETTYYWPKEGDFTFLATANGGALTIKDKDEYGDYVSTPTLSYTIPDEVANQKDVMVAFTGSQRINNNTTGAAVPLTFHHLCAAVQFELTSEVENTISSITISGVKGGTITYTYSETTGLWAASTPTADADYSISLTNNTIDEDNTLLLAPQTLDANATITVEFSDGRDAVTTEAGALSGNVWEMGKTFIYKLTITPEYTLEFVSNIEIQDSHYIIVPFTIKAKDLKSGWSIQATASDNSTVTLRNDLTDLQKDGYWIADDRGSETFTGTNEGEKIQMYAFVEENIGNEERTITLSLKPEGNQYTNSEPEIYEFSQYPTSWNGSGLGCEHIEDGQYPWGFKWDSGMKIKYTFKNTNLGEILWNAILNAYLSWFTNYDYIEKESFIVLLSVTIDFNKVTATGIATSETDGHGNTYSLYNFKGISNASDLMTQLENWGGKPDKTLPTNPTEFAARSCAMKNKYTKEAKTENGQLVEISVLNKDDLVWYLPAKNEISSIRDTDHPLSGTYWTSTSEEDGDDQAYKFTGNELALEDRDEVLNVRCVRKQPTSN